MGVRGGHNIKLIKNSNSSSDKLVFGNTSIFDLLDPDFFANYKKDPISSDLLEAVQTLKHYTSQGEVKRLSFFGFYFSMFSKPEKFTSEAMTVFYNKRPTNDQLYLSGIDLGLKEGIFHEVNNKIDFTEKGNNLFLLAKKIQSGLIFDWDYIKRINVKKNTQDLLNYSSDGYNVFYYSLTNDSNVNAMTSYSFNKWPTKDDEVGNFVSTFLMRKNMSSLLDNEEIKNMLDRQSLANINFSLATEKVKQYLAQKRKTIEVVPTLMNIGLSKSVALTNFFEGQKIQARLEMSEISLLNKIFDNKVKFRVDLDQAVNTKEKHLNLLGTVDNELVFFKELDKDFIKANSIFNFLPKSEKEELFSLINIAEEKKEL